MSDVKCYVCRNKPGRIQVKSAISCNKCQTLFHKSCAEGVSLNKRNYINPCCSKLDQRNHAKSSQNNPSNDQECSLDDEAEDLDPKLKQLWSLISRKIDSLSLNTRVDTIEERIGIIEETISSNNDNIANEVAERLNREKNIIIFNFQDSRDASKSDPIKIKNLFDECQVAVPFEYVSLKCYRLGKNFIQGKVRPLKIIFNSPEDVNWIFRNKRNISKEKLFIQSDLTPMQQEFHKTIRSELKRRIENGEKDLYIGYRNKIPHIFSKDGNNTNKQ